MEAQFNRRHVAEPRRFMPNDLVYARVFRSNQRTWIPRRIIRRHGRALYDVSILGAIWKRHINQLIPRVSQGAVPELNNALDVPLEPSLDTPTVTSLTSVDTAAAPTATVTARSLQPTSPTSG
ncbi:unnamed protein product [Haemonchus placei]|uniref:Integrase catalytic domain-containing protein n=1 Tax=Haemonchus placei TaxID=6290 RepID=A0A0N4WF64_HAEPC|nr:unnamed protein product [Haemonchus placei]